ncbi:MAG: cobalt transporter [Mogibacterium sp.]|nr:cobalt transporter [Mogibacterium sp.]
MHDGHHHHHHDHDHAHAHTHAPGGFTAEDEVRALLNYMYEHNKSHASELDLMVDQLEGEAAEKLHEAVHLYEDANDKLHEVLHLIAPAEEAGEEEA